MDSHQIWNEPLAWWAHKNILLAIMLSSRQRVNAKMDCFHNIIKSVLITEVFCNDPFSNTDAGWVEFCSKAAWVAKSCECGCAALTNKEVRACCIERKLCMEHKLRFHEISSKTICGFLKDFTKYDLLY